MCACGREVRLGFACGCVLLRVVCRVRFARVSCPWLRFVNVNTTDATTGTTVLLLPAQNTHTLHDPIRNPSMRALAAYRR